MNLFENLGEAIKETIENTVEKASEINISKGSNIKSEEIELAQKLDAVEEFSIDRFEGDIAVLENRKTGKIEEIEMTVGSTTVKVKLKDDNDETYYKKYNAMDLKILKNADSEVIDEEEKENMAELQRLEDLEQQDKESEKNNEDIF